MGWQLSCSTLGCSIFRIHVQLSGPSTACFSLNLHFEEVIHRKIFRMCSKGRSRSLWTSSSTQFTGNPTNLYRRTYEHKKWHCSMIASQILKQKASFYEVATTGVKEAATSRASCTASALCRRDKPYFFRLNRRMWGKRFELLQPRFPALLVLLHNFTVVIGKLVTISDCL